MVRRRKVFTPSVEADTSSDTEVMDAQDEGNSTDRLMPVDSALVPKVTTDETTKNANNGKMGK